MTESRTTGRIAWGLATVAFVLAAAAPILLIAGRVGWQEQDTRVALDLSVAVGWGILGGIVVSRQPENVIGRLFLFVAVVASVDAFAFAYASATLAGTLSLPGADWAAWLEDWVSNLIFPAGGLLLLILLFPDGHVPTRRWRWLPPTAVALTAVLTVVNMLDPTLTDNEGILPHVHNPVGLAAIGPGMADWGEGLLFLAGISLAVCAAVASVLRLRRTSGVERQQMKWFVGSIGTTVVLLAVVSPLTVGNGPWFTIIAALGFGVAVPLACGVAILKHGLYDVDVVINRTVVYGLLAAFVTVVYVGIVVGVGELIGSRGNLLLSIVATAVVAVSFQPVRERARRLANRLVYGKRATPYEVLAAFTGRVGETVGVDDLLPRMAQLLGEGTGARRAEVWIRAGGRMHRAASWPADGDRPPSIAVAGDELPAIPGGAHVVAVVEDGELLGALTATKPPGDPLTPTEDSLIADLASQAGLVLRNVRLIEDLRASRQRLVAAQDEERRKIERNLHDGAQQQLVALAMRAKLVDTFLGKDEAKARATLEQVQADARDALESLRELAHGIYPPLLADKGLAAALESQARKATIRVSVEADGIGRYPAEVEAAAYFCCLEALQNAAKYARAPAAAVRLSASPNELCFSVEDSGDGFDPRVTSFGAGLQNMSDRLAALGGSVRVDSSLGAGTTVTGRIPIAT